MDDRLLGVVDILVHIEANCIMGISDREVARKMDEGAEAKQKF